MQSKTWISSIDTIKPQDISVSQFLEEQYNTSISQLPDIDWSQFSEGD